MWQKTYSFYFSEVEPFLDVRFWRLKMIHALKGLKAYVISTFWSTSEHWAKVQIKKVTFKIPSFFAKIWKCTHVDSGYMYVHAPLCWKLNVLVLTSNMLTSWNFLADCVIECGNKQKEVTNLFLFLGVAANLVCNNLAYFTVKQLTFNNLFYSECWPIKTCSNCREKQLFLTAL